MSEQIMGTILTQLQTQGIPFSTDTARYVDMALRNGYNCAEVPVHIRGALGVCGVELLLTKAVSAVTPPPAKALESSDRQKNFLLSLNIPGMEQILYGQTNK